MAIQKDPTPSTVSAGSANGSAKAKAAQKWQDRQSERDVRAGRLPVVIHPQVAARNPEAERAILGACVLAYEAWEAANEFLTPEDFSEPRHELLFTAICECGRQEGGTIDLVTLDEQLKRAGHLRDVGQAYTADLVASCPNAYNYADYIRIVLDCSADRQKQAIGGMLMQGTMTPQEAVTRLQALESRKEALGGSRSELQGILASTVNTVPIRWLWRRRLARGKLAIVDGDPGLGKGLITMDLVARKSSGRAFPGDVGITQEPRHVILISPEDDIADTLVPRLIAARANLDNVHILNTISETDPDTGRKSERSVTIPRDLPIIEKLALQTGAELLIIDPIMGCLDSGVKTGIDSEVRSALMPLKHMATRTGLAVLMVRHLNKGQGPALYRGQGNIAFSALCRTAFIVGEHPDNELARVFLPVKSNIGKKADGLSFLITSEDEDGQPWVTWDQDACEMDANDVLSGGHKMSAERREILDALKSGDIKLPASPTDIAAYLGIAEDDKAGQATIRKRLSRMVKSRSLAADTRGLYALPTAQPKQSQQSQQSQQSHMSQQSQHHHQI